MLPQRFVVFLRGRRPLRASQEQTRTVKIPKNEDVGDQSAKGKTTGDANNNRQNNNERRQEKQPHQQQQQRQPVTISTPPPAPANNSNNITNNNNNNNNNNNTANTKPSITINCTTTTTNTTTTTRRVGAHALKSRRNAKHAPKLPKQNYASSTPVPFTYVP